MALEALIADPASGEQAAVQDSSVLAALNPSPPLIPQKTRIFRQYLTDDGTTGGSEDMTVAVDTDFWVAAADDADRYIAAVSFLIEDAGATLDDFGNLGGPLANGCQFFYESQAGQVIIHEALTTNFSVIRMCMLNPSFGDAATALRLSSAPPGATDAYAPVMDFTKIMPPYGVKLDMGTNQRLVFGIRDNIAAMGAMNAIAYGFDRVR